MRTGTGLALGTLALVGLTGCAESDTPAVSPRGVAKGGWDIDNGSAWTGLLQRGSLGGTVGDPADPGDDATSENCVQLGDGSIDLDFRPFIGGFQRASAIVLHADAAPYLALFGISDVRDGSTPTQLSPFWSETILLDSAS